MNPYVTSFMIFALFSAGALAAPDMNPAEAHEAARAGQVRIVDIRTPEEWRQTGVAPGAIRVNLHHPQGANAFAAQLLSEMGGDKNAPVALICRSGNRTSQAQKFLQGQGFTQVYNVVGGMGGSFSEPGWIKRGLPVENCGNC